MPIDNPQADAHATGEETTTPEQANSNSSNIVVEIPLAVGMQHIPGRCSVLLTTAPVKRAPKPKPVEPELMIECDLHSSGCDAYFKAMPASRMVPFYFPGNEQDYNRNRFKRTKRLVIDADEQGNDLRTDDTRWTRQPHLNLLSPEDLSKWRQRLLPNRHACKSCAARHLAFCDLTGVRCLRDYGHSQSLYGHSDVTTYIISQSNSERTLELLRDAGYEQDGEISGNFFKKSEFEQIEIWDADEKEMKSLGRHPKLIANNTFTCHVTGRRHWRRDRISLQPDGPNGATIYVSPAGAKQRGYVKCPSCNYFTEESKLITRMTWGGKIFCPRCDKGEKPDSICEAPLQKFFFPALCGVDLYTPNGMVANQTVVPSDTIFSVPVDMNEPSQACIQEIRDYVDDKTGYTLPNSGGGFDWSWVNKEGKLAIRISKWLFRNYGYKLSDECKSEIGNIVGRHGQNNGGTACVGVKFTRKITQKATDFFHGNSCWWQSYWTSRCYVKHNGGFGMLIYDGKTLDKPNPTLIGRAWVQPLRLSFNAKEACGRVLCEEENKYIHSHWELRTVAESVFDTGCDENGFHPAFGYGLFSLFNTYGPGESFFRQILLNLLGAPETNYVGISRSTKVGTQGDKANGTNLDRDPYIYLNNGSATLIGPDKLVKEGGIQGIEEIWFGYQRHCNCNFQKDMGNHPQLPYPARTLALIEAEKIREEVRLRAESAQAEPVLEAPPKKTRKRAATGDKAKSTSRKTGKRKPELAEDIREDEPVLVMADPNILMDGFEMDDDLPGIVFDPNDAINAVQHRELAVA